VAHVGALARFIALLPIRNRFRFRFPPLFAGKQSAGHCLACLVLKINVLSQEPVDSVVLVSVHCKLLHMPENIYSCGGGDCLVKP